MMKYSDSDRVENKKPTEGTMNVARQSQWKYWK